MYIEDGQQVNIAAFQSSANTFETKIYPTDRATFGSEWSPGIDDDVHLTILNAVGLGSASAGTSPRRMNTPPASIPTVTNEKCSTSTWKEPFQEVRTIAAHWHTSFSI